MAYHEKRFRKAVGARTKATRYATKENSGFKFCIIYVSKVRAQKYIDFIKTSLYITNINYICSCKLFIFYIN